LSLYLLNRICFVFIVVRCPLLLCFVYCVLVECVVTSCNVCYLSVVALFYYCHRAKTQLQSNNKYVYITGNWKKVYRLVCQQCVVDGEGWILYTWKWGRNLGGSGYH
jgi:hypothetical protein